MKTVDDALVLFRAPFRTREETNKYEEPPMKKTSLRAFSALLLKATLLAAFILPAASSLATGSGPSAKPTIVLVHGAFAGSSSWNAVVTRLLAQGYPVVAAANPLRGLRSDSEYVAALFQSVKGTVVAVGHSYAGSVITNAATGNPNVKALVYVAGLAPDSGESAADISVRFPGSTLGPTLAPPVALPGGGKDLSIQQDKFHAQFAADVPAAEAKVMAVTQRPVTESALHDPSGIPAWKTIPSWFIFGSLDKNITEAAHSFMAQRANAKATVDIKGASHVVMVSHPDAVVALIKKAAEFATQETQIKTTAR
jgi:pimeloyl-ACP methyl ester carboxylesterase